MMIFELLNIRFTVNVKFNQFTTVNLPIWRHNGAMNLFGNLGVELIIVQTFSQIFDMEYIFKYL